MSHVTERLCTNRFAISAGTSPDDLGETLPLPPSLSSFHVANSDLHSSAGGRPSSGGNAPVSSAPAFCRRSAGMDGVASCLCR